MDPKGRHRIKSRKRPDTTRTHTHTVTEWEILINPRQLIGSTGEFDTEKDRTSRRGMLKRSQAGIKPGPLFKRLIFESTSGVGRYLKRRSGLG